VQINLRERVTGVPSQGVQGEESMQDINDNLTIPEVARLLRCSKAHARRRYWAESRGCRYLSTCGWGAGKSCVAGGYFSGWKGTRQGRMQICQNAASLAQEREIFMRRKRFQKGSIRPRKHGKTKVWVAQWWDNGQKRSKVLGRFAEMPKSEAEIKMALILKPINEDAGRTQKPVYTFGGYLEEVFLPICRRKWKESTRMTTEPRMTFHLKPVFGVQVLRDITREDMQSLLDQKAQTHSRSIVDHLRWDLNNILKTALSDGLIESNPAAALFTPPCKAGAEKLAMKPEEIRRALGVFDARERIIFRMAVFDGMRPGEILAIRLGNVHEDSVLINQRIYKGHLDTPKGRKGKRTSRTVALSPGTIAELGVWRKLLLDQAPEAYLFPSERKTPLSKDNVWNRHMYPRLQTVALEWATFQVLRRTNATLSRKAKVDDKVAADQRGHGLGVSLEVYSLSDLEQKIEAVNRLEAEVIQK
jgi:integrase